jgi:hypothetical protein
LFCLMILGWVQIVKLLISWSYINAAFPKLICPVNSFHGNIRIISRTPYKIDITKIWKS